MSPPLRGRMLRGMTSEDHSPCATVTTRVSVRDLLPQDLPACTWSGSATHLRHVERELTRAAAGEVDYLAVCTPVDLPVAIGGIDYQVSEEAGTIGQLAVLPALQSCGLGTLLVRAAEDRIRDRGLRSAELAVEEDNPGPAPSTSAWATSRTAANRTPGTRRDPTDRSVATRRCASACEGASEPRPAAAPGTKRPTASHLTGPAGAVAAAEAVRAAAVGRRRPPAG